MRCAELCRRIRESAENRDFRLVRAPAIIAALAQNRGSSPLGRSATFPVFACETAVV